MNAISTEGKEITEDIEFSKSERLTDDKTEEPKILIKSSPFIISMYQTFQGLYSLLTHKTILHVVAKHKYHRERALYTDSHVFSKNRSLRKITNPKPDRRGYINFWCIEGDNKTREPFDLDSYMFKNNIYKEGEFISDQFQRMDDFHYEEQIRKAGSVKNAATLMIVILSIGTGMGIMGIFYSLTNDSPEIYVTGDYNENKEINETPTPDSNPDSNPNDTTVVIP